MFKELPLLLLLLVGSCLSFEGYSLKEPLSQSCLPGDIECFVKAKTQIAISKLGDGLPRLGINSLDPMYLSNITFSLANVNIHFPATEVLGTKSCTIHYLRLSLVASTMSIAVDCPYKSSGPYVFSGKIFLYNVIHHGNYEAKTNSIRTIINSKIETIYGEDGNRYWKLKPHDYYYEPLDTLHINLGDIFVTSVEKASPVYNELSSSKWWPLVARMSEPLVTAIVDTFHDALKSFFLRTPIDQFYK